MSRLVCVAAYDTAFDAYAVKGAIEEAGVPVVVEGEITSAFTMGDTPAGARVRVLVDEEHAARAREVVAAWDAAGARALKDLRTARASGTDAEDAEAEDEGDEADEEWREADEEGAAAREGGQQPLRDDGTAAREARVRRLGWTIAVIVVIAIWIWARHRR